MIAAWRSARRHSVRRVLATLAAGATFVALGACERSGGTNPDDSGAAATVAVLLQAHVLRVGDTLTASASALDSLGRPLRPRVVQWQSSDERVAAVSTSGRVLALTPGTARISALVGPARGAVDVEVVRPNAATVTIAPDSVAIAGSVVVELTALASDAYGQPIVGVPFAWKSTAPDVATVDDGGRLTGVAPGRAEILATVDGVVGRAVVIVTRPSNVRVTAVSPAQLVPGATVTITGSGFSTNRTSNAVLVGGVPATVRSATATQITATLAPTYPCMASRDVPLAVAVGGESGTLSVALQVAAQRALQPGQSLVLTDPAQVACNELVPAAGQYVVAVFNASPAPAPQPISLRGAPSALPPFAASRAALRAPAVAAVGDTVTFHVLAPNARSCSDAYVDVRARTVFVGRRVAVVEDVSAPLAGTLDDDMQRLGQEYDDVTYPLLEATFGNPLAMDARLERAGRVTLLFTRQVNDRPGTAGMSFSCDLLPSSVAKASNEQATVYLAVPTSEAAGIGDGRATGTRDAWRRRIPAVAAHETKHVISYAERLARGAPFEELWLEEGSALVAEELYARAVGALPLRANTGFSASLACELAPRVDSCPGAPLAFADAFARLAATLYDPSALAPLVTDPAIDTESAYYGSAWWLLRWAADAFAPGDAAFFRALVAGPQTGIDNLTARAGRAWPDLLGEWWLATAVDDRPAFVPQHAALTHPSWNLPDILAGAAATGDVRFTRTGGVTPRVASFGTFVVDVAGIRPSGAAIVELTGNGPARQLLDLRNAAGGPPAAGLGLAVVRVR